MPEPQLALSTIEWARLHGQEFRTRILLDNYEPNRAATSLTGYTYERPIEPGRSESAVVLVVGDELHQPTDSIYLFDTGLSVAPYYVAGYPSNGGPVPSRRASEPFFVILHPFPLSRGVRPDSGRPVDMSGWALGPRKAYHCKVVS
jgi:hypothetical protein